jgi:hypothetical protein
MNWKEAAKQYGGNIPATRPFGFSRLADGTVLITGHDVNVIMVIQGKDAQKLASMLPEHPALNA